MLASLASSKALTTPQENKGNLHGSWESKSDWLLGDGLLRDHFAPIAAPPKGSVSDDKLMQI